MEPVVGRPVIRRECGRQMIRREVEDTQMSWCESGLRSTAARPTATLHPFDLSLLHPDELFRLPIANRLIPSSSYANHYPRGLRC